MSQSCYPSGPLMSSIADLTEGRIDVDHQSKTLQSSLDLLLQSYVTREKMYTDAVKKLQDSYNDVLREAEHIADEMKTAASEEASKILATVKEEASAWEAEKAKLAVIQRFEPRIKLDVGGVKFTTSLTTLCRFPDTMIGAMFSGRHALPLDEEGYHFIDRDGTHFRYILNFLRSPEKVKIEITGAALSELKGECEYYGLLDLMFPFNPIPPVQLNNNAGQAVTVTQDHNGIWRVNSIPVTVCPHCGVADYIGAMVVGHRHTTLSQFSATVKAKGGIVLPDQPKPTTCKSCGRQ